MTVFPMPALAPIVGITSDRRLRGGNPFQYVGEKYIVAVREGAGAIPFLIPSLDPALEPAAILPHVDGLLFTGSPSNVAPRHYGGHAARDASLLDEARDAVTLPLMRAAVEKGVPILCICRGFQELNVAFGGTLHQHLHEVSGFADHRANDALALEDQYGPAHEVEASPGGILMSLLGDLPGSRFKVNSLHSQGIAALAPGFFIEATAPDGAVEAISLPGAPGFVLGVQWHPEWKYRDNPVSRAIFAAFGDALRHRQMAEA